jgi:hypothetical protein
MVEEHTTKGPDEGDFHKGMKSEASGPKEVCPMASMCKGMMGKSGSRFLLMIPGLALVVGGVVIFIEPRVLFWLMGGTSILIGIVMLALANFIRKIGFS